MIQTELSNKRFTLKQGDQLTVTEDCYCEHDLYEITKYYRKGLELKTLKEGDKVDQERIVHINMELVELIEVRLSKNGKSK